MKAIRPISALATIAAVICTSAVICPAQTLEEKLLQAFGGKSAQNSAAAKAIDTSKIADPKAKAAVEQVGRKLTSIGDYSCQIVVTSQMRGLTTLAYNHTQYFKRPNLYYAQEKQTAHFMGQGEFGKGEDLFGTADEIL